MIRATYITYISSQKEAGLGGKYIA